MKREKIHKTGLCKRLNSNRSSTDKQPRQEVTPKYSNTFPNHAVSERPLNHFDMSSESTRCNSKAQRIGRNRNATGERGWVEG